MGWINLLMLFFFQNLSVLHLLIWGAFYLQGLTQINMDVVTLAAKAREGKLQPQEFQVR